jgi:small subunit ribosomal protein S6
LNTYECMYIIQTNLSDEETDKANTRIAEEIEKRGGSVLHRDRLGRKRLAYSIAKHDDGIYYLMHFELPPGEISALRSAYRLHPRLLRSLILRKEPEEVPKAHKRSAGRPETAEEAPGSEEEKPTGGEQDEAQAQAPEPETQAEPAAEEAPAESGEAAEPEKQE